MKYATPLKNRDLRANIRIKLWRTFNVHIFMRNIVTVYRWWWLIHWICVLENGFVFVIATQNTIIFLYLYYLHIHDFCKSIFLILYKLIWHQDLRKLRSTSLLLHFCLLMWILQMSVLNIPMRSCVIRITILYELYCYVDYGNRLSSTV